MGLRPERLEIVRSKGKVKVRRWVLLSQCGGEVGLLEAWEVRRSALQPEIHPVFVLLTAFTAPYPFKVPSHINRGRMAQTLKWDHSSIHTASKCAVDTSD